MRLRLLLGAVGLVMAIGGYVVWTKQDKEPNPPKPNSQSNDLVLQLLDEKSRSRAFFELMRHSNPDVSWDFDEFLETYGIQKVIVCPQEKGEPPVYIVLFSPDRSWHTSGESYPVDKPGELFPSAPGFPQYPLLVKQRIEAFTANGHRMRLFQGQEVIEGMLTDLNGDGMIDWVNYDSYRQVLSVSTVTANPQPMFAVLLNLGAEEWTFRLVDQDGDGIRDIEGGPQTVVGFKPKVVWKWDRAKKTYTGPTGQPGDHFRVFDDGSIENQRTLAEAEGNFPRDSDAVVADKIGQIEEPTSKPVSPRRDPWAYTSMQGASDADIVRFMARGKSEFNTSNPTVLPESFWAMDAKQAALALINANRTDKHRAHYQLAIDDRDKLQPPLRCTITFCRSQGHHSYFRDERYFLRVDAQDSYLAYTRSMSGYTGDYNVVHDQSAFDLRFCPVSYEDARKIAAMIWWLDRARSSSSREPLEDIPVDNWRGQLIVRAEGQVVREHEASLLTDDLAGHWSWGYAPQTFVSFASYLLTEALPARLGNAWAGQEVKISEHSATRGSSAPLYTEAERKRLHDLAERFLAWYTPDQDQISLAIVAEAAQVAGALSFQSAAGRLREIQSTLPPPGPVKRTWEEVNAERDKLAPSPEPFLPGLDNVKPLTPAEREKKKEIDRRVAVLDAEINAIHADSASNSVENLRGILARASRRLAVADDAAQLLAWATSKEDGAQWALQRLAKLDANRYADALEALVREGAEKDARDAQQCFRALADVDLPRAAAFARGLSAEAKDALAISAFLILDEAGNVPEEAKRLAAITAIMHDPKIGWEERDRAIDLLVPRNEPLRYPGREVDEALLKLLEPGMSDPRREFILEQACRALARRGRTEHFERMRLRLQATDDSFTYHPLLGALTHLAQFDLPRFKQPLLAILKPHLSNTGRQINEVLWAIWSADLRELQPDLERLATAGPDESEDSKARSFNYAGAATPVTGRFHLARKIVSLWREPDAFTRARLLATFAALEADQFSDEVPERQARWKAEMERALVALTAEERRELAAFQVRVGSAPVYKDNAVQVIVTE